MHNTRAANMYIILASIAILLGSVLAGPVDERPDTTKDPQGMDNKTCVMSGIQKAAGCYLEKPAAAPVEPKMYTVKQELKDALFQELEKLKSNLDSSEDGAEPADEQHNKQLRYYRSEVPKRYPKEEVCFGYALVDTIACLAYVKGVDVNLLKPYELLGFLYNEIRSYIEQYTSIFYYLREYGYNYGNYGYYDYDDYYYSY